MEPLMIIAHRGDSANAPENTLPAFERAWHLNVDFVELDYHQSRDGVPVVIHDDTVDRTTNAYELKHKPGTRVDSVPCDELIRLDAARWPSGQWRAFRPTPLPTVETILSKAVAIGRKCAIERKAGEPETICQLIQVCRATEEVVLMSFEANGGWDFLAKCQEDMPSVPTAYLVENDLSQSMIKRVTAEYNAKCVNCYGNLLTQRLVEELRSHGIDVWAWTINDPERAKLLINWGVTAITTDIPGPMILELGK